MKRGTEKEAVSSRCHTASHVVHEYVRVVLAPAVVVCVALPLLLLNDLCSIGGNEMSSTINLVSNGPLVFPLYALQIIMVH